MRAALLARAPSAQLLATRLSRPRTSAARFATMAASGSEPTINFDRVNQQILVGSCLRNDADAEKAKAGGASVVFSLQDDADLAAQQIDAGAVAAACSAAGVKHVRVPTSDTDEAELRQNLPAAVAKLAAEVEAAAPSGGAVYVHCNGGRGRAPTIAVAYLFWLAGMALEEAAAAMTGARSSQPKLGVIAGATADLLGGGPERRELSQEERAVVAAALRQLA